MWPNSTSNKTKSLEYFYCRFSWTWFGLAYSPLNSAKLSCSSEVTLLQIYPTYRIYIIDIMQTFYYYFLVVLDELLLRVDLVAFWLLLQIGVLNSSSSSSLIFNFSILTSVSKRTGTAFLDFNWGSLDGLSLTILGVTATWAPGYIADPCRIGDGSKFKFRSFLAKARDMAASLNTLVQYGIGFWKTNKIKMVIV